LRNGDRERAAYKKQRQGVSSNTGRPGNLLQSAAYFGRTEGSPPGLPGGGITGVLPVSGVGARISGSTPEGGHITPSDFASLSSSGSLDERPTVDPSGVAMAAPFGGIGAQLPACANAGGAACCGGVAAVGGCCARTAPSDAASTHVISNAGVILMRTERMPRVDVPPKRQDLR
jgi:hypothetical protein